MSGFRLAVDYGTTNTVAVLLPPDGPARTLLFDGSPLLPSAVYAGRDGELLVGRDAVRAARLDPGRYEPNPKRRIDDGEVLLGDTGWQVTELIAAVLAEVGREAARVSGTALAEFAAPVLTCPVSWSWSRRAVLVDAARRAGLAPPVLVTEPVAAAAYFTAFTALPVGGFDAGHGLVVYDLGAGTFDVSVVHRTPSGFEPLAHRGLDDIGGIDLDELVIAQIRAAVLAAPGGPDAWHRLTAPRTVRERRAAQALRDEARAAKEALSRHSSAEVAVPLPDRDLDVLVGREEFERLAGPALHRTVRATTGALGDAGLTTRDLAGIFLVGGASRVPLVATLLHRATGLAPTLLEQPETVVAHGAHTAATVSSVTVIRPSPAPAPPAPDEPLEETDQPQAEEQPAEPEQPDEVEPADLPERPAPVGEAAMLVLWARGRARLVAGSALVAVIAVLAVLGIGWWSQNSAAGNPPDPGHGSPTASPSPRYALPGGDLCTSFDWSSIGFAMKEIGPQASEPTDAPGARVGRCSEEDVGHREGYVDPSERGIVLDITVIAFPTDDQCAQHYTDDRDAASKPAPGDASAVDLSGGLPGTAFAYQSLTGQDTTDSLVREISYGTFQSNVEILVRLNAFDASTAPRTEATRADALARSLFAHLS